MESMTRMFPITVITLTVAATRTMRTISTAEYGLPEERPASSPLLLKLVWDKFRVFMLSGFGYPSQAQIITLQYLMNTKILKLNLFQWVFSDTSYFSTALLISLCTATNC